MKKPISATINENLIDWLNNLSKNTSIYRNKSHIIEIALEQFKSQISQEKKVTKKR